MHLFAQVCIFYLAVSLCFNLCIPYFPFLLPLICSERCDTKPLARGNQVRPRDAQAKKQQSATLPASSKPAGGTAATARHREGASGAKKTAKTTGKTGSSTQAKVNPRSTNNTIRGIGKFSELGLTPVCLSMLLPACLPAWKICLYHCLKGKESHDKVPCTCKPWLHVHSLMYLKCKSSQVICQVATK